ncbi:hypothetical protein EUGRSUZ_G02153 [Eucalyptus grandis]|uniref:Uncharacterized protein n=2 Tax=Eucalyptus grandis TaxID=71139 RepID=A0ACC3K5L0_EUCGR|nr:hypothetical protein EUGRSUZ_G02153 [Eucalyptus grandis]
MATRQARLVKLPLALFFSMSRLSSLPPSPASPALDRSEDALQKALDHKQASGAPKPEIGAANAVPNDLEIDEASIERQVQDSMSGAGDVPLTREAERVRVINTPGSRRFYLPSSDFDHFGVNSNVFTFWREHFRLEEDMFPQVCFLTEYPLKAWDVVESFGDLLVKDVKTGACYRADDVLEDFYTEELQKDLGIKKAAELKHVLATLRSGDLSVHEVDAKIKKYGVTAPHTKNPLSEPYTSIGTLLIPERKSPKSALGILRSAKCFKALLRCNNFKLPFSVEQLGKGVCHEVPHHGLGFYRFRKFILAEIEHFVDPEDKSHPKFSRVADLELFMLSREQQISGQAAIKTRLGEAVSKGTVNNETLGYFIGRVYLFLTHLGIDKDRLRFRQRLANEMALCGAHCWDAEIECSYGWIECVLTSDGSTYEFQSSTVRNCGAQKKCGAAFVARKKVAEPREVEKLVIVPNKKELGLAFRGNQKMVVEVLEAMGEEEALRLKAALESKGEAEFLVSTMGKSVIIKDNMVNISKQKIKEDWRVFTPSVIKSSFGMGRIIYCLFEHSFYTRPSKVGDEQLNVLRFPPFVAPIKCTILPLIQKPEYESVAQLISESLTGKYRTDARVPHKIDIEGGFYRGGRMPASLKLFSFILMLSCKV